MSRIFKGKELDQVAFPLGGLGAGSVCLQGNGALSSFSLWNRPNVKSRPTVYSAVTVCGEDAVTRVLEAPVPETRYFVDDPDAPIGLFGKNYGMTRFTDGVFSSRFPFASIQLVDEAVPVTVEITGWSPFIPGDEDRSGLPFAAVEYTFHNPTERELELVYYFNCENFINRETVSGTRAIRNGVIFQREGTPENPELAAAFCATLSEEAYVDTAWFRGGWFDTPTILWNRMTRGEYQNAAYADPENGAPIGATLAVPFKLAPGADKTLALRLSWYMPDSTVRTGRDTPEEAQLPRRETYRPWYTTALSGIDEAARVWEEQYETLRRDSQRFTDAFYRSTVPEALLEAAAANLSILKSPTILRQTDGRLWGWEGCRDNEGVCDGSCTHVWNYAQAICHLFPRLERSLRQSEFNEAQSDETGHQEFRVYLPIRKAEHHFHAASDGQLGGIMKMYRDWQISGDTAWLRSLWPRVRQSMEYCINEWDTGRKGVIDRPHHNTYDIEFWGSDGMSMSFYLGALQAYCRMAEALGEDCTEQRELFEKGKRYTETELYNGEYFYQKVNWDPEKIFPGENEEARELIRREGPKYQYGTGCLSDGILGVWMAELYGLSDILDAEKVESSLQSVYRYNFKSDLRQHANPQRPGYAAAAEGGLLLCSWPKGGKPSLPFIYSDEVWCGIEYQMAAHLIARGMTEEGLAIVKACRARYNGVIRNPYNEYECGYWYARSMASYALLQAYTGVRYSALTKTLYYRTNNSDHYTVFLATATGYGLVTVAGKEVSVEVIEGTIEIDTIQETDRNNHPV